MTEIQLQMEILKPSFRIWSIVSEAVKATLELSRLETLELDNNLGLKL